MRRLEGQHLAALGQQRLDLGESRAAACGDHQFGRFVGHDAGIAAGVDDIAGQRLPIEVLGAAATQPDRPGVGCGRTHLILQLLEFSVHLKNAAIPDAARGRR